MASLVEVDGRKQENDADGINVCEDAQTKRSLPKVLLGPALLDEASSSPGHSLLCCFNP